MNNPQFDIILPCYNPGGEWVEVLIKAYVTLAKSLPKAAPKFILVNDGSSEPPKPEELKRLSGKIPGFTYVSYEENRGKGYALRQGVQESDSEICLYTDMDFPYELQDVIRLYDKLSSGAGDIVVGIKNQAYYEHVPWARIQISKMLQFLSRTFLRISITDTQCGLKGFNQKGKAVFLQTTIDRYLCDLEFIYLADRNPEVRMIAQPIQLRDNVQFGRFGWKTLLVESMNFAGVFLRSLAPGRNN